MTKLAVRLTLLAIFVAAGALVAYQAWTAEHQARARETSVRTFEADARRTAIAVADLRAAQQAYVAVGQGQDFWFARVTATIAEVTDTLSTLKSSALAPQSAQPIDDAIAALQDFEQVDKRARDFARGHQLTQASDLIFADGFDLTHKAGDAVDRAMTAELTAGDAAIGALHRQEAYALAGAAGVTVVVVLLLLPVGRKAADLTQAQPGVASVLPTVSTETLADLDDFGIVAAKAPGPVEPAVDLEGIASLCADLARIADTRALPALLERAAAILGASGIVLWIADPDGRELTPILVHGYPPNLAMRLGTLARDASNVTASAYRTGLLQTVKGDSISNGAVAAPLVAAGGCVGVMAAEVKNGGEQRAPLLAAATIIASQLATLVGPPSARAKNEATAV